MKKIGIIGCGWLGLHLAKHLATENKIICTNTTSEKRETLQELGFESVEIHFSDDLIVQNDRNQAEVGEIDCFIICIPFSRKITDQQLRNRFHNLVHFLSGFDRQIILMSSIGIYPESTAEIDESTFDDKELNPQMLFIENLFQNNFPNSNILRLGGLMGANRIFSKYANGDLSQVVNHVHYQDICCVVERMIENNTNAKIYNVVAPLHPSKQEIINYQTKKEEFFEVNSKFGKTVSSKKLQIELAYDFILPDPVKFAEV
ncbi:MAG: epimerase [Bacteroidota bacterium]